jgi:hypothetical protein
MATRALPTSVPGVVERLRHALDAVSEAVMGAHLDGLISAESELAAALGAVCAVVDVPAGEQPALVREIGAARVALGRCQSLGAAIGHVADASLAAQGLQFQYDRAGQSASLASPPTSMDVRA